MGVDSFDKTRFRLIDGHPSLLFHETESGGRDDVLSFDLIAQYDTGMTVFSTVIPTSFPGVDSIDKAIFRFIAGHPSMSLQETELGGWSDDVSPFDLVSQH